jgi:hypothetical protein
MVLKWIGRQINTKPEVERARRRSRRVRRAAIKFERIRRNHTESVNKSLFLFLLGALALAVFLAVVIYH